MQISIVKTIPLMLLAAALTAGLGLKGAERAQAAADAAAPMMPASVHPATASTSATQALSTPAVVSPGASSAGVPGALPASLPAATSPAAVAPIGVGATFEGAYAGTLGGDNEHSAFQLLVLPQGDFFAVYGENSASGLTIRGYMHGRQLASSAGGWSASGREFGIESPTGIELKANPAPDSGVAGTVIGSDGLVTRFSGTAMPSTTFDYNRPAQLSSIVGTWAMATPYDQRATLAINQDARLSGSVDGCAFSGKATPQAGRNVFDVAMTFGGEPCVLVGQTARGIALAHQLPDGRQQLMVMVQDDSRSEGGLLVGSR